MTTITIPKDLIKEKDLIIIPRLEYENLFKRSKAMLDNYTYLWQDASKKKFIKSYDKADAIYDRI